MKEVRVLILSSPAQSVQEKNFEQFWSEWSQDKLFLYRTEDRRLLQASQNPYIHIKCERLIRGPVGQPLWQPLPESLWWDEFEYVICSELSQTKGFLRLKVFSSFDQAKKELQER